MLLFKFFNTLRGNLLKIELPSCVAQESLDSLMAADYPSPEYARKIWSVLRGLA